MFFLIRPSAAVEDVNFRKKTSIIFFSFGAGISSKSFSSIHFGILPRQDRKRHRGTGGSRGVFRAARKTQSGLFFPPKTIDGCKFVQLQMTFYRPVTRKPTYFWLFMFKITKFSLESQIIANRRHWMLPSSDIFVLFPIVDLGQSKKVGYISVFF